jgi:hypothetical protein
MTAKGRHHHKGKDQVPQRSHRAMTQADDDARNPGPPARKVLAANGNEDNS